MEPERVETQKLLSIARTWQEFGLKSDFEKDWETDTLFQYIGKDGEIATLKATDGGATFDLPLGEVGYERVFGVTQVKTDRSLPHWHAYNETKILGLNPNQSYFLSDTPRDFSQVHINTLPEGVSLIESRVTENAALFRLEKTDVRQEIDLLAPFHLVRTGIVVNGQELPQQKGAIFRRIEASVLVYVNQRLRHIRLGKVLLVMHSENGNSRCQRVHTFVWNTISGCKMALKTPTV